MSEGWLFAVVTVCGAAGSVARFAVDTTVRRLRPLVAHSGPFPVGTLMINISGSFVLGLLTGLVLFSGVGADWRTVIGTGFCGGFTTFSTASFESVRLYQEHRRPLALLNLAATLVLSLAAAAAGIALGRV